METDLIFNHGADLPEFAAFPLVRNAEGATLLGRYYAEYAAIAARAGTGLLLETPTEMGPLAPQRGRCHHLGRASSHVPKESHFRRHARSRRCCRRGRVLGRRQRCRSGCCNDANYPAAAWRARDGGANVLCYPLNNMLVPATAERWRARSIGNLIARARETRCWVVSSDVVGTSGGQVSFGCTAIVGPAGDIRARVPEGETGRILLDLLALPHLTGDPQVRALLANPPRLGDRSC